MKLVTIDAVGDGTEDEDIEVAIKFSDPADALLCIAAAISSLAAETGVPRDRIAAAVADSFSDLSDDVRVH